MSELSCPHSCPNCGAAMTAPGSLEYEIDRLREAVWRAEADTQMHKHQVKNANAEIERLRLRINQLETECGHLQADVRESCEAARFLIANLDHAAEYDVETTAERRWPWLKEVGD